MKFEKSLYLTMCGQDCDPNIFLKIPIMVVWPFQLDAQAVAICVNSTEHKRTSNAITNILDNYIICWNSWFATTWQGGHVSGQYNIIFLEEFTWKWSLVPPKKDAFVLDLQYGRRDVTSKPAIEYMYQGKFRR